VFAGTGETTTDELRVEATESRHLSAFDISQAVLQGAVRGVVHRELLLEWTTDGSGNGVDHLVDGRITGARRIGIVRHRLVRGIQVRRIQGILVTEFILVNRRWIAVRRKLVNQRMPIQHHLLFGHRIPGSRFGLIHPSSS
jgi:hypothetical protein